MRKPTICICENKDADQLRGYCEADQRLCFRYIDSTLPLLLRFEITSLFCACTASFVSDLFGNHTVGSICVNGNIQSTIILNDVIIAIILNDVIIEFNIACMESQEL